jgi:hypothetical protein
MSAVSTYNVGLGLLFPGQNDDPAVDGEMSGYPQDPSFYATSYVAQGKPAVLENSVDMSIAECECSSTFPSSSYGQFCVPRISRSEGEPSPSPTMPMNPSFLSPRLSEDYSESRMSSRFHAVRSQSSSASMMVPPSFSVYANTHLSPSTATFADTPIASPMQPAMQDSDSYAYFHSTPVISTNDEIPSGFASPSVLQHSPDHAPADYYSQRPLVSPPVTPMAQHTPYATPLSADSLKMEFDERSVEYPLSPYTSTYYSQHLFPPQPDIGRRPVSAGRQMPQRDLYAHANLIPLKRTVSLNSSRYGKSSSPLRSSPSLSPPSSKRPAYSKWTREEDEMLRHAISVHGTSKWSLVASLVPGRTAMQCSTRWQGALNTAIHKGKWEPEEDRILIAAVEKWRAEHLPRSPSSEDLDDEEEHSEVIPWGVIATMLPRRRTGIQCQARWSEALDPTIRKGKWTTEEDEMLFKGVEEFGQCWIKVSSRVKGRTQRQIRTRWMQIRGREKS